MVDLCLFHNHQKAPLPDRQKSYFQAQQSKISPWATLVDCWHHATSDTHCPLRTLSKGTLNTVLYSIYFNILVTSRMTSEWRVQSLRCRFWAAFTSTWILFSLPFKSVRNIWSPFRTSKLSALDSAEFICGFSLAAHSRKMGYTGPAGIQCWPARLMRRWPRNIGSKRLLRNLVLLCRRAELA